MCHREPVRTLVWRSPGQNRIPQEIATSAFGLLAMTEGKERNTMGKIRHPGEEQFYEAVLSLQNLEQCRLFFEDISTIKELQAMSQRLRVAALLDGGSNYLEVSEATGASSATISRVNRCLNYGGGYRTALDNLKKREEAADGSDSEV